MKDENNIDLCEKFCSDLEEGAKFKYNNLYAALRSDFHLYDHDKKLEIIQLKKNELLIKLKESKFKTSFSVKDIKKDLKESLKKYYKLLFFPNKVEIVYSLIIDKGKYEVDYKTNQFIVYPSTYFLHKDVQFDFTFLNEFKPLEDYITCGMLFNKLNKIETKIKQKKAKTEETNYMENETSKEGDFNINDNSKFTPYLIPINRDMHLVYEVVDGQNNNDLMENNSSKKEEGNKIDKIEQTPIILSDLFESKEKYDHIMDILVNKKLCAPKTHIWIDEKKGNKGALVALIKYLHALGYYKNNKKPAHKEIQQICINTFGLATKIDNIKSTKTDSYDMKFLPFASSLDK